MPPEPPKLLDQVRNLIRLRHMSRKTERAYVGYIRDFILFHKMRHPREMSVAEMRYYLSHLAVGRAYRWRPGQDLQGLGLPKTVYPIKVSFTTCEDASLTWNINESKNYSYPATKTMHLASGFVV